MFTRLRTTLHELYVARDVLYQLTRQQLILRYRRTMLGYFWTLVNPLMMMSVTAFVFANLFHQDLKTFAVFMFGGMLPWNCFSAMISQSSTALINNEGLIKKIYLPKTLFPLSVCSAILIDSVLSLFALLIIIFAIGGQPSWAMLFLPISYLLLFFFTLGLAMFTALATAFFRDLQHVVTIALQALFFLTPVLYDKSQFVGKLGFIFAINPLTPFIALFRQPILHGEVPDWSTLTHAFALAVASMAISLAIFLRNEKKIVFRL